MLCEKATDSGIRGALYAVTSLLVMLTLLPRMPRDIEIIAAIGMILSAIAVGTYYFFGLALVSEFGALTALSLFSIPLLLRERSARFIAFLKPFKRCDPELPKYADAILVDAKK